MNRKERRAFVTQKIEKPKLEDDRTPLVKKIDWLCRIIAIMLAILVLINVHVLVEGGGAEDKKIVPIFGIATSNFSTDVMEPTIEENSAILTKAKTSYNEGDIVQYLAPRKLKTVSPYTIGRIEKVNNDSYDIAGDNKSENNTDKSVKIDNITGEVIASSSILYGIHGVFRTSMGALVSIAIIFLLLMMGDFLMIPKRKRELEKKKEIWRLQDEVSEKNREINSINDKKDVREKKKAQQLEKEKAEIQAEMKRVQKQMKEEEEELTRMLISKKKNTKKGAKKNSKKKR